MNIDVVKTLITLYPSLNKLKIKEYSEFLKKFEGVQDKRDKDNLRHQHHIIPLSFNKGFSNITVDLSIRAHFIVHHILLSLFSNSIYKEEKRKSQSALFFMSIFFCNTARKYAYMISLNEKQNFLNKDIQRKKAIDRWKSGVYSHVNFNTVGGKIRVYNRSLMKEKLVLKTEFDSMDKSIWIKGRIPFSKETKEKMSKSKCGEKSPKARKVRNIETGEIFNTLAEAEKKYKVSHLYEYCKHNHKTAGGYHWEYYNEK